MKRKLDIAVNFENDWGYFCDPDDNDNDNKIFQNNLYKPIKKKYKKIEIKKEEIIKEEIIKEEEKMIEETFIDLEKLEKLEKLDNKEKEEDKKNINTNSEIVFDYIKKIFITFTMVYFIFKIV